MTTADTAPGGGHLADNIVRFGRLLRRAGLPAGPATVIDAIRAAEIVGVADRGDFRTALHSVFVSKREQRAVFDAAFDLFWRSGHLRAGVLVEAPPAASLPARPEPPAPASARVAEAFFAVGVAPPSRSEERRERRLPSAADRLRRRDFAQMTADELAEAIAEIKRLALPADRAATRRFALSRRGLVDPRRTMRQALRRGGDMILPVFREPKERPPPIVAIADISGSMSAYSRVLLHFLHALSASRRVETFLFGTRLSNVSRALRLKDPDSALAACSRTVVDWSGGTRIGAALHGFNRDWSRRVLGQGATVLLITDGLERDGIEALAVEMDRLHRSCRRLIWLNPLLGFDGFAARARGIRAMLPHVDEFRTVHSLESVADLARALAVAGPAAIAAPRRHLAAS